VLEGHGAYRRFGGAGARRAIGNAGGGQQEVARRRHVQVLHAVITLYACCGPDVNRAIVSNHVSVGNLHDPPVAL
jgi:hypothetical protein